MSGDPELIIDNSSPPRIGRLAEQDGRQVVIWSDGSRGRYSASNPGMRRVRAGTLQAEYAADPEGFLARLASDPAAIYVLALTCEGRRNPGRRVKFNELQLLVNPFVPGDVDPKDLGKKATAGLRAHPNVEYLRKPPEYVWHETAPDPLADIDTYTLTRALQELGTASQAKGSQPKRQRLLRRIGDFDLQSASAADQVAAWSLQLLDSVPAVDATVIWDLDEATLAKYFAALGDALGSDAVSAALSVPRPSNTADALVRGVDPATASEVLLRGLEQRAASKLGTAQASPFLQRLQQLPGELNREATAELLRQILLSDDPPSEQVLNEFQAALSRTRISRETLAEAVGGLPRPRVLRAVRRLPWLPEGSRVRLFDAVIQAGHADELNALEAWQPVSIDDLAALVAARSPLSQFLLSDEDPPSLARRIVDRWAQDGWSRQRLAAALGWPNKLLELLPEGGLGSAVASINSNSPTMQRLFADPRARTEHEDSQRKLDDASRLVESAQEATALAQQAAQRAAAEARHERDLRLAAEELLQRARRESTTALQSQLRQAQVDAVQALARVLDDLAGLAASSPEAGALMQRALIAARSVHLDPIGETGEVADFDPAVHERADDTSSARITVGRPGYVWFDGSQYTVLRKALVTGTG